MREGPILFSEPMVLANLRDVDPKTMTRRALKPDLAETLDRLAGSAGGVDVRWGEMQSDDSGDSGVPQWLACSTNRPQEGFVELGRGYGNVGDRLWCRETFFAFGRWETRFSAKKARDEWHFVDLTIESGHTYHYAAGGGQPQPMRGRRDAGVTPGWWKRPAIFMPRAASRTTLLVKKVRVERLQDISEADAIAEGIERGVGFPGWYRGPLKGDSPGLQESGRTFHIPTAFPRLAYRALWESINGPDSWDANPWLWVVDYERFTQ